MNKVSNYLLLGLAIAAGGLSMCATPTLLKGQALVVVGAYDSMPGEHHDTFLQRVADSLNTWAYRTGTEVCGPRGKENEHGHCVQ